MNTFIDYISESEIADEWLQNHVRHNLDKYPSLEIIDDLLHEYPYSKSAPLYRGLNFADEEQYRTFIENTNHGTELTTKTITSWTPDMHTATPFAITRPTYFLNKSLMQAEGEKTSNRDYMIGHAGIILKIDAPKGKCIDVTASKFAAENEVIVVPGTYKISIAKTFIPFVKSIDDENYEEVLAGIEDLESGFNRQKLEHILFRFADLSNESKQKLWDLYNFNGKVETYVDYTDSDTGLSNAKHEIKVGMTMPDGILLCYRFFLPEHQQIIRSAMKDALTEISKQIDKIVKEREIDYNSFRIRASKTVKLGELITGINAFKNIDRELAAMYHKLNSPENLKDINKLPRGEQLNAIQKFSDDLVQILNNLSKNN